MSVGRLTLRFALGLYVAAAGAAGVPAALKDGLLVAAPTDVALRDAPLESLTAAVIAADFPDTTSVLVFKNDRLVFERYFGSGGINVLNDTRSVTKTLTALIVGQAIADGALRTARPAGLCGVEGPRAVPPRRADQAGHHAHGPAHHVVRARLQ